MPIGKNHMGIIDTSTPRAKFGIFLLILATPFILILNFLKWIGQRLGLYKPPVVGLTPEQIILQDELRKKNGIS